MDGEQDPRKMQTAQELLQRAQRSAQQGTVGSTQEVSEALSRVEDVLATQAKTAPDQKSEKAVTDMAKLVGAAEQLVVEKDIGDRLQRISREAELVQMEQGRPLAGKVSKEKAKQLASRAKSITSHFGPFFQLVMSSHEFRRLVVDFIKIARAIFLRSVKVDVGEMLEDKWLQGKPPKDIAKEVAGQAIQTSQNDQGKIEVLVTEEELTLLQEDLLELFAVIASDQNYRDVIEKMLELTDFISDEVEDTARELNENTDKTHAKKLQQETKELVAEFTGHEAVNRFLGTAKILAQRIKNDVEARKYLSDLKSFILQQRDPQDIKTESFKRESKDLIERGRSLVDHLKNKPEVENFLNACDFLMENLKNDDLIAQLRERAGILVEDLTYEDDNGRRQLDTQVLGSIRKVIVPVLADALKYIPIPRLADSNYKREYVVENVVLCGYDVIPENIFVHLESDSWVSVRELETERSRTRLIISLNNFRTEIKDIQFYYKRKQFPELEESGRATLRIGGKGASLTMMFKVDQQPGDVPRFTGGHVEFTIDHMDIEYDRATLTHDVLVPMLTGMFKREIIKQVEKGVAKNLGGVINDIGRRLSDALIGTEKRFSKQLDVLHDTMKRGEFSRKYEKRQEKLE